MNIDPYLAFLILGGLLIASEVLILQASIGWLLLLGLSALITALLLWLISQLDMTAGLILFLFNSAVVVALLYRPMKYWQNKPSPMQANDAYGQEAIVIENISDTSPGKVEWSGTQWNANLDASSTAQNVEKGKIVIITKASGITLTVKAK